MNEISIEAENIWDSNMFLQKDWKVWVAKKSVQIGHGYYKTSCSMVQIMI